MRRGGVAFLVLALIGLALVGCGRFGFEQREAWRTEAEESCLAQKHVVPSAYMSRISEIDGPGVCGVTYPFRVAAFAGGSVALSNKVTLACPIVPEIDGWLADTVQPAAALYLGSAVAELKAGTYSCRSRNHRAGAKISEHAFGNAIDVMSFRLADGRVITVEQGWKGAPAEQDFLREVFVGACRHFTTVLAPGSDVHHYNHLHLDLAHHDPRGRRHYCRPIIKFTPRLDPDRPAGVPVIRPILRSTPEPQEPLEPEDEGDPYAVSAASRGPGASRQPVAAAVGPLPRPAPHPRLTSSPEPTRAETRMRGPAPIVLQPQLWTGGGVSPGAGIY